MAFYAVALQSISIVLMSDVCVHCGGCSCRLVFLSLEL